MVNKAFFYPNDDYFLQDTAFYICRGGWPLALNDDRNKALRITKNYCDTLFQFENSKNQKFRNKKPAMLKTILKSYARNVSSEARKGIIINDIRLHEDEDISEPTFDEYVEALNDLFIVKDIEAWNPNFRSKTVITSSPTRHFVDTSIAAYSLRMSPDDLLNDPSTFGMLFEDFAVKELSIYAGCLHGKLRHYRDSNGLECDAVIHLENGQYALAEIKLGGDSLIKDAVSTLKRLKNKIEQANQKPPAFSMIVTACGNARTLDDGIYIVPINLLRD